MPGVFSSKPGTSDDISRPASRHHSFKIISPTRGVELCGACIFQNPSPQGKLVSVWQGEVFDVAVDLRQSSPTFGKWHGLHLSSENKRQFYMPPGFGHGFVVLSETALFHYKCTEFYAPKDEMTIRWDDPDIGIEWPAGQPTLSEKDAKGLRLRDVPRERLFP